MDKSLLRYLDMPLAHELAENYILQRDLNASIEALKLWHEKYADQMRTAEQLTIGQALFRDAVIQFAGCFDKTASFPLSAEDIYGKHPDGMTGFQWFKDMRDAYAAHKFGSQRQCEVGITTDANGALQVGKGMALYLGPRKAFGPQIEGYMRTAAKSLDSRIAALEASLLEFARGMSRDAIAKLRPATTQLHHQSRMSRPALRKKLEAEQNAQTPNEWNFVFHLLSEKTPPKG